KKNQLELKFYQLRKQIVMSLYNKYKQILTELITTSKQEDLSNPSINFDQKLAYTIKKYMDIPFKYSKGFEDYIKQQVEIICKNEQNIEFFINWRNLIEQLKEKTKILTKQSITLLDSLIETANSRFEALKTENQLKQEEDFTNQIKMNQSNIQMSDKSMNGLLHTQSSNQIKSSTINQQDLEQKLQAQSDNNQNLNCLHPQQQSQQHQILNNNNIQDFNNKYEQLMTQQGDYLTNNNINQKQNSNLNNQQQHNQVKCVNNNWSSNDMEKYLIQQEGKQALLKSEYKSNQVENQNLFDSSIGWQTFDQQSKKFIIENEILIYQDESIYLNSIKNVDKIDQKLYEIYSNQILEQDKKKKMMEQLKYVLNNIQQNAEIQISKDIILKAYLFGSFLQGTCLKKESDIDLIIIFENNQLSYRDTLLFIQETIKNKLNDQYIITQEVSFAFNVPIISIQHVKTGYKIDITYENRLAILNSQLFNVYLNIDFKIKVLSVLFKIWAVKQNIKKTDFLTSYALLNMVIYFLISQGYLVSLQHSQYFGFAHQKENIINYSKGQKETQQIYTSFEKNIGQIKSKLVNQLQKLNEKPLHKLITELFSFYRVILNHNDQCKQHEKIIITTRLSTNIMGVLKYDQNKQYISIQDPFNDQYNPGQRWNFDVNYFYQKLSQVPLQFQDIDQLSELFD
ncbi:nucleotidyltransferase domain protein, partial (macronuclear) [Tetrahymena thermophila SB210]